jgi:hypothetical protein
MLPSHELNNLQVVNSDIDKRINEAILNTEMNLKKYGVNRTEGNNLY